MHRLLLYRVKLSPNETCRLDEAGALDSHNPTREGASESQPRWYLVQCRARQEERAQEHLQRQGFECYRPHYEGERIRGSRKELASVALFPGYLFIRLDRIHDNWLPIRSTRGVTQIVRFNAYPLPVADGIIEQLRQRVERGWPREPYLQSGERVMVTEGSFSGIEAIFLAGDGDRRVILLLNILHSEQRLSFPIGSVRKLGSQSAIKLLMYEGQGFWFAMKRLSQGKFLHWPSSPTDEAGAMLLAHQFRALLFISPLRL